MFQFHPGKGHEIGQNQPAAAGQKHAQPVAADVECTDGSIGVYDFSKK